MGEMLGFLLDEKLRGRGRAFSSKEHRANTNSNFGSTLIKGTVNRPHASVMAIVALERTVEFGDNKGPIMSLGAMSPS
ncbi:SWI/SNF complex subunit SWI3C [Senna tora]|uniref:SWI/SNF complex subunit SWI3C n=1 Tax=Senna tora TaxID=362788 RepID=A0A834WZQ8_9FABA|nr:SWI/SNF complex subunit SWI3C [Senna tora]